MVNGPAARGGCYLAETFDITLTILEIISMKSFEKIMKR